MSKNTLDKLEYIFDGVTVECSNAQGPDGNTPVIEESEYSQNIGSSAGNSSRRNRPSTRHLSFVLEQQSSEEFTDKSFDNSTPARLSIQPNCFKCHQLNNGSLDQEQIIHILSKINFIDNYKILSTIINSLPENMKQELALDLDLNFQSELADVKQRLKLTMDINRQMLEQNDKKCEEIKNLETLILEQTQQTLEMPFNNSSIGDPRNSLNYMTSPCKNDNNNSLLTSSLLNKHGSISSLDIGNCGNFSSVSPRKVNKRSSQTNVGNPLAQSMVVKTQQCSPICKERNEDEDSRLQLTTRTRKTRFMRYMMRKQPGGSKCNSSLNTTFTTNQNIDDVMILKTESGMEDDESHLEKTPDQRSMSLIREFQTARKNKDHRSISQLIRQSSNIENIKDHVDIDWYKQYAESLINTNKK